MSPKIRFLNIASQIKNSKVALPSSIKTNLEAEVAFRKGIKPEYKVVNRIKNHKGHTISAEFEKINGFTGFYNQMYNRFSKIMHKIIYTDSIIFKIRRS